LLAPKKVTKKRHPLPGPLKRDSLVISFFCGRRHKLVPIYRDSDMRRLRSTKKTYNCGLVKMGPRIFYGPLWGPN